MHIQLSAGTGTALVFNRDTNGLGTEWWTRYITYNIRKYTEFRHTHK